MTRMQQAAGWIAVVAAGAILSGCQNTQTTMPDYGRPLPPGARALRKLDRAQWPDLSKALNGGDGQLAEALDRSLEWYKKPSTQQFFPIEEITHEQARASTYALRQAIANPATTMAVIERDFDIYTSVGWDGNGGVLFTAYYSPIFDASKVRTNEYQFPLYTRPADLVTDPSTGEVLGRKTSAGVVPYPTRAQIEAYPDRLGLAGKELVWFKSRLDRYIVHVNGSARLRLTDGGNSGGMMYVGYSATNGLEYTSIGKQLVADGKIDKDRISLPAIEAYFKAHPDELEQYTSRNDRYVFFQQFNGGDWPAGSLGAKLTPMRSLATDKTLFPRGCPTLVVTTLPNAEGWPNGPKTVEFEQFMVDQDTGGAIRTAGRADLYLGVGARPGWVAGRQAAEGRLYYLILKPQSVAGWTQQMNPLAASARPSVVPATLH